VASYSLFNVFAIVSDIALEFARILGIYSAWIVLSESDVSLSVVMFLRRSLY